MVRPTRGAKPRAWSTATREGRGSRTKKRKQEDRGGGDEHKRARPTGGRRPTDEAATSSPPKKGRRQQGGRVVSAERHSPRRAALGLTCLGLVLCLLWRVALRSPLGLHHFLGLSSTCALTTLSSCLRVLLKCLCLGLGLGLGTAEQKTITALRACDGETGHSRRANHPGA